MDNLEEQINQIEQQLATKRAELERQKSAGQISELPHEKEILREVVRQNTQLQTPDQPPSSPAGQASQNQTPSPASPPPHAEPPSYLSDELKSKVQELVDVAFSKSIAESAQIARKSENAALIDAFHDALVDELYNHLVQRGKLKQI